MSSFLQHLFRLLFHLGYLGPFVMGVLDSSFLFLPFGNDLLVIALVARHHDGYLLYVLTAACGSTAGVFLIDLVARKIGESGVTRVAGKRRFEYLSRKIGKYGAVGLVTASLSPPPFPFTMVVAINSALGFPRIKLLLVTAISRAARFLILGALAIKFGRQITRIANSPVFKDVMLGFIALCLIGSIYSIATWFRRGRSGTVPPQAPQPAEA